MAAVGAAIAHKAGGNAEMLHQLVLQARAVESGKSAHLAGFQSGIQQGDEAGDIGRIKNHHHMFHIRAILTHVFAELFGNLGIAFEKVFASHAGLAGCASGVYNIGRTTQSLGHIGGPCDSGTFERTLIQLLRHTFKCWCIWVVEADIGCQAHHECGLRHVGSDHAGGADNHKFLFAEIFHSIFRLVHAGHTPDCHYNNPSPKWCAAQRKKAGRMALPPRDPLESGKKRCQYTSSISSNHMVEPSQPQK